MRYSRSDAEGILIRWPPRDLATMNLFDRKLFLPVDVVITLAINVVLVVLGLSRHGVGASRGVIDEKRASRTRTFARRQVTSAASVSSGSRRKNVSRVCVGT